MLKLISIAAIVSLSGSFAFAGGGHKGNAFGYGHLTDEIDETVVAAPAPAPAPSPTVTTTDPSTVTVDFSAVPLTVGSPTIGAPTTTGY